MVGGSFGNVCVSVRLCVCASVRLSQRKSAVTFEPADGSARNFQGRPHSSQVIFGRVNQTPRPTGSGPDPEKWGFRQIYLLPGFWSEGVVSYLFGIKTTRRKKRWERNFEFRPMAGENWAERPGRPVRRQKFWNLDFFHKRDPRSFGPWVDSGTMRWGHRTHPGGPRGPARGPGGQKLKVKLGTCL